MADAGLGAAGTRELLVRTAELAAEAMDTRRDDAVAPPLDASALAQRLDAFDFQRPLAADAVVSTLVELLRHHAIRSDHPRYFGLFNPPALAAGVAGDLIAAAINPQLAVWAHAPAAAEIERRLIQLFGALIWSDVTPTGSFTSGGSEANASALLTALARSRPGWATDGLAAFEEKPRIYVSAQSHLAWLKIARGAGLGSDAVRLVDPSDGLSLDARALAKAVEADEDGLPVLLVATAGTTAHGAIDDLEGIAALGARLDVHVHVDAAWAGAVLLHPAGRSLLKGIAGADSVTIDPHKWLAVPMGAGLYLTRDGAALQRAFGVSTEYMPSAEPRDPYVHSAQWSRRFIGAKLFVALATLGVGGYADQIERQFVLGDLLKRRLSEEGFAVRNDTPLPLACFAPPAGAKISSTDLAARVVATGRTWLSTVTIRGESCLRACITSFETTEADVEELVGILIEQSGIA